MCLSLRSDKVTWRARGKDTLKDLAAKDRSQVCFSNYEWWEVTQALLEYETKELSYARTKNKDYKHENAIFFKTYVKQGLNCAMLSSKKVQRVLKHILHVIHDQSLDASYHREYLDCLCDLIETPRVSRHAQDPRILTALFNYLRLSYTPAAPSSLLLRLVKALCKVVYLESASQSGILVELLEWLTDALASSREALSPSSSHMSSVVMAFCGCYTSLMELHGSNCLSDICFYVDSLLDTGNYHSFIYI
jgi:hypothetical protein